MDRVCHDVISRRFRVAPIALNLWKEPILRPHPSRNQRQGPLDRPKGRNPLKVAPTPEATLAQYVVFRLEDG